jgi:hypothetical protein
LLRDQAKSFYGNIINGINPEAAVTYQFSSSGA